MTTNEDSAQATGPASTPGAEVLAIVTGTTRGIGAGVAAAALASGATLAACNRREQPGDHHLTADLADSSSWGQFDTWINALIEKVRPARLVAVHNAATLTPIGFAGEVDPDAYTTNVLLNSAAPQVVGDAVLRAARTHQIPTVLAQISSGAAESPYSGWSSYCAAKAAVEMWVRVAGAEVDERGDDIRICAIRPGVVATGMQAEIRSSSLTAFPDVARFQELHANEHLRDPATVGSTIWSAVSTDEAAWANGARLDIEELAG